MAEYWRGTPLWWRLLAGYLLIDPSFVVGVDRYDAAPDRYGAAPDRRRAHAHYLGGAIVLWVSWLAAIAVGATAGAQVPAWLHLELLIPLYLIGEIVPKVRQAATRSAVLVAAAVALLCISVPMHLGIAVAIVAGILAGSRANSRAGRLGRKAHATASTEGARS
jgi:predicted branched-subunit amino acid permease